MVRARAFIAAAPWRFAASMPHQRHWYTVRGQTPERDFEWFVDYIREQGYDGCFQGSLYRYLNVDGWRYWTMGAPVRETTIINRARAKPRPPSVHCRPPFAAAP